MMNISSRLAVQTGDNVGIGGFIAQGNSVKKVIVRGIGPSLNINGTPVPGRLEDPVLELHAESGVTLLTNDNWRDAPNAAEIESNGFAPSNEREAVILVTLLPGNYTAILQGKETATGVGLVEIYDLDSDKPAHLANLSTRANVLTDDDVLIGGVILGGNDPSRVVLRAIGPSLRDNGVTGALDNPTLALHDGNGALLMSNDDWREAPNFADIQASGLAPPDDRESAILTAITSGNYTAIVRGVNRTTGIGLVEIYNLGK